MSARYVCIRIVLTLTKCERGYTPTNNNIGHTTDSGSEGSEESGIFSTGSSHESPRKEVRRPGLGRRAITQLNMRVDKTASYNNALAKSQENIVKVGLAQLYQ